MPSPANDGADFLTDLPDPASLSDSDLQAQIDERVQSIITIQQQLTAEGRGFTDRGRHWRARATTARAAIEAQVKVLRQERSRRQRSRADARTQRRQDLTAAHLRLKEAKALGTDAVRFLAAAKRMLPRETYRAILAAAQPDATPPPAPEPAAAGGSAPP